MDNTPTRVDLRKRWGFGPSYWEIVVKILRGQSAIRLSSWKQPL